MATQGGEEVFLFEESHEEGNVGASCIALLIEPADERAIEIIFRFRVHVQGTEDQFDVTVRGEIRNPIFTTITVGHMLLHYSACVALHTGWAGVKALKRAYSAAKKEGRSTRAALISEIQKIIPSASKEVTKHLRGCVSHAFIGALPF